MERGRRGDNSDRPQRRGFRGTAENAKTKICTRWEAGNCRFGDRCNFAHGDDELRDLPARPPKPLSSSGRGRGRGRGGPPPSYRDSAIGADNGANGSRDGDQQHSIWVASGRPIKGPNNWTQYTSDTGEKYYHHSVTNETQWEAPPGWNGPV